MGARLIEQEIGGRTNTRFGALHRGLAWARRDGPSRWIAIGLTFFVPITSFGVGGISTLNVGIVAALLVLPIWFPAASGYRGARIVQAAILVAVLAGVVLVAVSSSTHSIDLQRAISFPITMVFTALTLGLLLWVRGVIGIATLALAYGAGALVDALIRTPEWGEYPWKYGYSWPCAVILLSLVIGRRFEKIGSAIAFGIVAIASVGGGYRSLIAFSGVALLLYLFFAWNKRGSALARRIRFVAVVIAAPLVAYFSLSWLLLSGILGTTAAQRSAEQIEQSGSLLVGGRQEWAAAVALFKVNPWGFGPGVVPTAHDIVIGKQGLATIGADNAANKYHENTYIFGGLFRFHSYLGDFWSSFGFIGIALALIVLGLVLIALVSGGLALRFTALQTLLAIWTIWDVLFSPVDSNWRFTIFALSILLLARLPSSVEFRPALAFKKVAVE